MVAEIWLLAVFILGIIIARYIYRSKLQTSVNTEILVVITILLFALIVFLWFIQDIIAVIINGLILYILFLRISAGVVKYKNRRKLYLVSGLLSVLIVIFLGNPLPLWRITSAGLMSFVLVQAYLFLKK